MTKNVTRSVSDSMITDRILPPRPSGESLRGAGLCWPRARPYGVEVDGVPL